MHLQRKLEDKFGLYSGVLHCGTSKIAVIKSMICVYECSRDVLSKELQLLKASCALRHANLRLEKCGHLQS